MVMFFVPTCRVHFQLAVILVERPVGFVYSSVLARRKRSRLDPWSAALRDNHKVFASISAEQAFS